MEKTIQPVESTQGVAEATQDQVIIEKVAVVDNGHGKKVYSAIDQNGMERAHEVNPTVLERAYGAALGDPKWKGKGAIYFNPSTAKWVRVENVEVAKEKLAPKAEKEKKARTEKPKAPTAEMVKDGKLVIEPVAETEQKAEVKAEAKAEAKAESKANKR